MVKYPSKSLAWQIDFLCVFVSLYALHTPKQSKRFGFNQNINVPKRCSDSLFLIEIFFFNFHFSLWPWSNHTERLSSRSAMRLKCEIENYGNWSAKMFICFSVARLLQSIFMRFNSMFTLFRLRRPFSCALCNSRKWNYVIRNRSTLNFHANRIEYFVVSHRHVAQCSTPVAIHAHKFRNFVDESTLDDEIYFSTEYFSVPMNCNAKHPKRCFIFTIDEHKKKKKHLNFEQKNVDEEINCFIEQVDDKRRGTQRRSMCRAMTPRAETNETKLKIECWRFVSSLHVRLTLMSNNYQLIFCSVVLSAYPPTSHKLLAWRK